MFVFSNRGRGVVQKMSNFSAISWREQFTFDKKLMSTLHNVVLEQLWEVYFYSASSLIQCFTPLWNSILADSELASLAFNPRWLAEKQHIQILVFGVTRLGIKPSPIYCTPMSKLTLSSLRQFWASGIFYVVAAAWIVNYHCYETILINL